MYKNILKELCWVSYDLCEFVADITKQDGDMEFMEQVRALKPYNQ